MHRRDLIRLASAAAAATALPRWSWSNTLAQRDLFPLGVASGSPTPDGFVLWTRLLDGPVPGTVPFDTPRLPLPAALTVRWEVAEDEAFRRIVRAGQANALAELGHAVHVEVSGLRPDRWYFYRFMHGDAVTQTARTRTAPALHAMPGRTRFAFVSCQRWEQGHYAGYRHMLDEDLDLVVFLGDYVYEYAMPKKPPSYQLVRTHTLPAAKTLADFRDRYALYKTDAQLQAAHRACPWLVTWDDHEVQNDYAGLEGTGPAGDFLARRGAGYQAFYENMPLRASVLTQGVGGLGTLDGLRIHERHAWGRLLRFHMLDTRQYRDRQPCRVPGEESPSSVTPTGCPELRDPARSILGSYQERWLEQGLAQDAALGERWSVVAQQTIFAQRNYKPLPAESYHPSTWDGYPASRQRVLDAVQGAGARNTVFLGGDIHQNYVSRVLADFSRPQSPVIASEFCGTSIASASGTAQSRAQEIADNNPHILLARSDRRGYAVADVTPGRWLTSLRVLDDVAQPDSGISTLARFAVDDCVPGPRAV
ncbi:alkaline phosphatase [Variovorax paradoxus]|jgi:alkaline phosphatase D|uniref:alkaline phosphatase D family protein n=1 Tax=Variovorax paradoxus TaxID=34073 RepID=UPI0006E50C58|nr:alkaline phosphatase [Variovorax paradoxus]KPU97268.1 alkaline phosphatase [Variovorax paradoxus]KPV13542.1 alkaline phosphatase [Variovorax paradoxus]KPV15325.1 alkaline phosphatase [Variovorax paradoxus]KPV32791.1 alkaline phosphatase [Variovorax paradoxus]